ncbi:MAG TPA: YqcI/YcgG family protein [Micromonosporaceae bacterium]|nr:YqcI/YcgG family protein [Micromonosporaceae bacterium]
MHIEGMPVVAVPAREAPDPWWTDAAAALTADLADPRYPCHFGHIALSRGELFATFFDRGLDGLAGSLREFLDQSGRTPARRLALAAFRRPEEDDGDERSYADEFWRILQHLHDHDDRPWPDGVPSDPDDPMWEFSFHGSAMFVFAAAPSYKRRRSRSLGAAMVLLFQPRNVFAGIEGGTAAGIAARRRIRAWLAAWDGTAPHPDLGDYGDPSNHEWRQYFIADGDSRLHERCPLRIRNP